MQRVIGSLLVIVTLLAAVWLSVFVFLGILIVGAVGWLFFAGRRFLMEKGILNPTPGVPLEEHEAPGAIIDGDFQRLDDRQPH